MASDIDDYVARAQAVPVTKAAAALRIRVLPGDRGQPCPRCGGKDRFAIHAGKEAWYCRGCDAGGRSGLGLAGHALHLDLRSRAELLKACEAILGEPIPDGGLRESDAERAARAARIDAARQKAEADAAAARKRQDDFREGEINKARGIYFSAGDGTMTEAATYLLRRTGFEMPAAVFNNIRFDARHTYWHGLDDFGRPRSHHVGPAMIAPFVDPAGRVTGCHETWLDLRRAPKFRPDLGFDDKGEPLPAKKMRGVKKGSLIPLCGAMTAWRWLIGEGIETVLAVAGIERFRPDTFYAASGDRGNLSGPAEPKSAFAHPTLRKADAKGVLRAVRIPGPVPKAGQGAGDALVVAGHVTHLVLLADGDSERIFTASAMARAEARLTRAGRDIGIWWPAPGNDFADIISTAKG